MNIIKFIKKYKILIVIGLILVGILAIIKEPVFFDIFGLPVFLFILFSSIWALNNKNKFPEWVIYVYLSIGVLGTIIDLINVLKI